VLGHRGSETIDFVGWMDSDWAQDLDSQHSVGGFVFDITGSAVL
jgi:hypothetical protein